MKVRLELVRRKLIVRSRYRKRKGKLDQVDDNVGHYINIEDNETPDKPSNNKS